MDLQSMTYEDYDIPGIQLFVHPFSSKAIGRSKWAVNQARKQESINYLRTINIRGLRYPGDEDGNNGVDAYLHYKCPYRYHNLLSGILPPLYTPVSPNIFTQASERWPTLNEVVGFLREDTGEVVLRQNWSVESLFNDRFVRALYSKKDLPGRSISDRQKSREELERQESRWLYWEIYFARSPLALKCLKHLKRSLRTASLSGPRPKTLLKECEPLTFIENLECPIVLSTKARS